MVKQLSIKTFIYFLIAGIIFLNNKGVAQSIQAEDPHAKAIRLSLQAGGLTIKPYPMSSKQYGPFLLKLGFGIVNTQNYVPLRGDMRVFQPYLGGDPNGFIDMFNGSLWVSDYKETGFWPSPKYEKYHPSFQVFRWINK